MFTDDQPDLASPLDTWQETPQPDPQAMGGLLQRLGRLVDDLLFLARQDSQGVAAAEPCPVDALVMEVTQEQVALAQAQGVKIHLELPTLDNPDTLTVWGNYSQLGRLLTNVIRNAWQYTPSGGQVWVRLQPQGDSLTVTVQDTGVGIDPVELPRVFDRFYRVDRARGANGGSGLGLAIAQSIVQAHQGTIHLTSQPGQGTLVTLTLPRFKGLTHRGSADRR